MSKIHQKAHWKAPERSFIADPKRKSQTVPNQSMTIGHILEKYTRGIQVSVHQKDPVYVDQSEFDYEKLNRADFAEKAAFAEQMRQRANEGLANLEQQKEERQRRSEEAKKGEAAKKAAAKAGIDPLDNTMPDDTKLSTK